MSYNSNFETKPICPLCSHANTAHYYSDIIRSYFQCGECNLVFVPPQFFISSNAEKAEYDLHQNSPNDPRYRQFLNRLFVPMNERLKPNSFGLDFGSGPGPTLSVMFEEAGHRINLYDPFYTNNHHVFNIAYDFITATEVFEHLHSPKKEIFRLWRCLKFDGILGIMTKLVINPDAFSTWHYKNDPTHVCFYSKSTFEWIAHNLSARIEFIGNDVILLHKKQSRSRGLAVCAC